MAPGAKSTTHNVPHAMPGHESAHMTPGKSGTGGNKSGSNGSKSGKK